MASQTKNPRNLPLKMTPVEKVGNVIIPGMGNDTIPSLRREAIAIFMNEWKASGKLGNAYIACKRFIDEKGIGLKII